MFKDSSGNIDLINCKKTAFLCSQQCPADIVLKSYDWAIEQRDKGNCVISGFHSKIEKDVFHFLLKGKQPIILALARGLKKRYEPQIQKAINGNRLLIISPFGESVKRITKETAIKRNEMMAKVADEIFVAYASQNGKLINLMERSISEGKKVFTFNSSGKN
ncbi:MAG: hypothetical protein SCARUB_04788 [Candidatus Scalindua rubra]|uniref:Smf/DprA SLOG domain-containing protein n=1 Tax=Candidatus Scalindua rubra TaxID=1872076 RepID=A0A1E3X555_9BACT|nr:MAG: hypothetical protein SCARUB_04788 [Candidatus Scalindua rubra]